MIIWLLTITLMDDGNPIIGYIDQLFRSRQAAIDVIILLQNAKVWSGITIQKTA